MPHGIRRPYPEQHSIPDFEATFFFESESSAGVQVTDLCGYALRRYLENGEEVASGGMAGGGFEPRANPRFLVRPLYDFGFDAWVRPGGAIRGGLRAGPPRPLRPATRPVSRLNNLLAERSRGRAIVDVQNPVYLDRWSLPQPDLALLRPRPDFYTSHPEPGDFLLVVEVSDTSLRYDRELKFPS